MKKLFDTSLFTIKPYDRLFCYNWGDDINFNGKSKFGQHFVKAGNDPIKGCEHRINLSVGVVKSEYTNAYIQIDARKTSGGSVGGIGSEMLCLLQN